jgi:hypothetical protein
MLWNSSSSAGLRAEYNFHSSVRNFEIPVRVQKTTGIKIILQS